MASFLRSNFDKILLFLLVISGGSTTIMLVIWKQSPESIAWAQNLTGSLVGAMLAILTGRAMSRASDSQGGSNGNTTDKPPVVPPAK